MLSQPTRRIYRGAVSCRAISNSRSWPNGWCNCLRLQVVGMEACSSAAPLGRRMQNDGFWQPAPDWPQKFVQAFRKSRSAKNDSQRCRSDRHCRAPTHHAPLSPSRPKTKQSRLSLAPRAKAGKRKRTGLINRCRGPAAGVRLPDQPQCGGIPTRHCKPVCMNKPCLTICAACWHRSTVSYASWINNSPCATARLPNPHTTIEAAKRLQAVAGVGVITADAVVCQCRQCT